MRPRLLLGLLILSIAMPALAERDTPPVGLSPASPEVDVGIQPLGVPSGVISAVMSRDRILRQALESLGTPPRFHAFWRGADIVPLLADRRLEAGLLGDMPTLMASARGQAVIVGLVKQTSTAIVGRRVAQVSSLLRADFDRIVMDCPAGYNELTEQVIAAADLVIVPLPPSPLSARSLDQLRRELLRTHHRHPPILPVLSMYNSRRPLHREVARGSALGWPTIPYSAQLEQSAVHREPLGSFAPKSEAARYLGRLWSGIEAKIGERRAA